ncbi:CGNR zinc finger domain-containing protein [Nocardia sp. CDC153]|uniref:CGNR zinc finger domain-containing protein n=1 Tax=Nocardia sp. CDC153 TaxID=3112167 RepID=UPI002DB7EA28|nr:CGNR zinc finger domain-containing protein [Nocardia sp. CDC153]MEC3952190.1 CGNR zinc finger domain-containing protein [Nocardia sp. CDC153]
MADLEPLIGEPLALDLVNTRPLGADLLETPAQLADWLRREADRLPEPPPAHPTARDLAAVRDVREHLSAALDALLHGRRPPAAALRGLTAAQSAAPAIRRLDWNGDTIVETTARLGDPGTRLAAHLADAAATLLTDPAVARIRQCAAQDCVMLFLPAHPRRQWCSPDRCGNRVRVARYYQRHKAAD